MRWAVPRDTLTVLDADVDRPLLHPIERMASGEAIGFLAVKTLDALRIGQDDAFFLARLQGENAHLEGSAIDPFEQGRVLLPGDDALVDIAAVVAFDHAPFHARAIDIHRQPR